MTPTPEDGEAVVLRELFNAGLRLSRDDKLSSILDRYKPTTSSFTS